MLDPASKLAGVAVLTAAVGFVAGWWLHRLGRRGGQRPAGARADAALDLVVAQERDRSLASSAKVAELGQGRRIARLEQDLGARSAQVAALREETARLAKIRHALETKLARCEEELAGRGEELEAALARLQALETAPRPPAPDERPTDDRLHAHIQALEARLREAGERAAEAATAHATTLREERTARSRLQARLGELETRVARVNDLELQLTDNERRQAGALHDLEAEARRLRARNAELEPLPKQRDDLERALRASEEELRQRLARIEALEGMIKDPRASAGQSPSALSTLPDRPGRSNRRRGRRSADRDNLQLIHGIGPVIERRLNRLGITRFGQIAHWTDEDIARIAGKLEDSTDRIQRDRWVQSARREHGRKYGNDPVTGAAVAENA